MQQEIGKVIANGPAWIMSKLFKTNEETVKEIDEIDEDLRCELVDVQDELDRIRINFEDAEDPDLIDMYVYQLKAVEARYKHLLKLAKNIK